MVKKLDIEKFPYEHIFKLILDVSKFNEKNHGNYVRDTLMILLELEKNGETIIDVDKRLIYFELLEKGWPNKHLKVLKSICLLNSDHSPFILTGRNLSLAKWSGKIDRVITSFLGKIDSNISSNLFLGNCKNKLEQIEKIFESSNLVFLQGGPGTGKTTLIINFILNILKSDNYLNIGISAPTGKATARLKESLNEQKEISLGNVLDQIECQTLHRWILNSRNKTIKLKFNLKELDLFIIDEMSMVSIDMIESVLTLLAKDCKIILVGDKNQLSPVKNCSIWNYLFEHSENKLINSCIVNLNKTFRNNGNIELISRLVFSGDDFLFYKKIKEFEQDNNPKEVNILRSEKKIPEKLINLINEYLNQLKNSTSNLSKKEYIFDVGIDDLMLLEKVLIDKIFLDLQSQLILCEKNTGIWSVEYLNEIFLGQKSPYNLEKLDEGVPIMCTKNNNELGISNGDIGVLIGFNEKRRYLFRKFNENNQQIVELIEPSDLENVVPAIAITIHKSQGSESEKVSVLWPKKSQIDKYKKVKKDEKENIFLRDSYEKRLFYTAITRAKKKLDIYYLS